MNEKVKSLTQLVDLKEKAIRQCKMVLKFREEALRKLERADKQKRQLEENESAQVIVSGIAIWV